MGKNKNKSRNSANHFVNSEISALDVISLLSLKNIRLKDSVYAIDHTSILKSNTRAMYEVMIEDVDGEVYTLKMEVKIY